MAVSERNYIHNLTEEALVLKDLAKGTAEGPTIHEDLTIINPHADPLSFYFSVQAADSNLLVEVNFLGSGHHGPFAEDHIYSDINNLQFQYDYWLL
jgi:hypothetical protein